MYALSIDNIELDSWHTFQVQMHKCYFSALILQIGFSLLENTYLYVFIYLLLLIYNVQCINKYFYAFYRNNSLNYS